MRIRFARGGGATVAVAVAAAIAVAFPAPAMAAKSAGPASHGSSSAGSDISWPQCGGAYPSGQAFGIVGVNHGRADDFNSCFVSEIGWAAGSPGTASEVPVQIYANTGDPGNSVGDWPKSGSNGYGDCSGGNDLACAWEYGYNMATADIAAVKSDGYNPAAYPWWLDVETANTWQGGTTLGLQMNIVDIQGMQYALEAAGIKWGIYSTSYQWTQITAGDTTTFAGVPNWVPGARTERGAQSNCTGLSPFTGGKSTITLTQWTSTYDYDYPCGG